MVGTREFALKGKEAQNRRKNQKQELWLEYYLGECELNATEAARKVGYKHPRVDGPRLAKVLADVIDSKIEERKSKARMGAEEAMALLADIARNKSHRQQIKALELHLKIHGLLSEEVHVHTDKQKILSELDEVLEAIGAARGKPLKTNGFDQN